jgi:hypothetical protein
MRRTRRSKVEAFKWLGANEPLTKAVNQNYIGEETNAKLVSPQTGTTMDTSSPVVLRDLTIALPLV